MISRAEDLVKHLFFRVHYKHSQVAGKFSKWIKQTQLVAAT